MRQVTRRIQGFAILPPHVAVMANLFPKLTGIAGAWRRLRSDARANVAVTAALVVPLLVGAGGLSVDYFGATMQKSSLQEAVDAAAIAAAREMMVARPDPDRIRSIAKAVVEANFGSKSSTLPSVEAFAIDNGQAIKVNATITIDMTVTKFVGLDGLEVTNTATARISGGGKLCVLAVDDDKAASIFLTRSARLTANGCSVHSNSGHQLAMQVLNNARLQADTICTVGGNAGGKGSYLPEPITDCPPIPDPLASRPAPPVGACTHNNINLTTGVHVLTPGVYCGGLVVRGDAQVDLRPGIYVIRNGPLWVHQTAQLRGEHVGFYFSGLLSSFHFTRDSVINLSAPKDGVMAGILFFEERNSLIGRIHQITSNNARRLLGTIYIPKGNLFIDSNMPVADHSEYTALVVRRLILDAGPNLVINADYASTPVPVPDGLGPHSKTQKIYLEN